MSNTISLPGMGPASAVAEQFPQAGEDFGNGIRATHDKPVNVSDYTATPVDFITKAAAFILKASVGNLYRLYVTNDNAAAQLYALVNKATAPTTGDTPVVWFYVPTKVTMLLEFRYGKRFSAGIGLIQTNGTFAATVTISGTTDTVCNAEVR